MNPPITITVDLDAVSARLRKLMALGADLRAPLTSIGRVMRSSVLKNVMTGGRYEAAGSWRGGNTRWQDLAESTKAARAKRGKWPGPILEVSEGGGGLMSSMSVSVGKDSVTVGTNKPYGGIHQFGGMAGPGRKVPIPARPYLVVQDEDIEDMTEILDRHISKL
jgi:phage virion morphogenesis protein